LFEVAEGDWKGLILTAYFTGGRLVDLVRLTWGDVDLSEKTITFVQRKTGSPLEIRQKLTGHASKDMNKHYTHLELETVRRAVESISRLPGKTSETPQ
jgi:hypothetical protein